MITESPGQDSNQPKDRLSMETGKLVPVPAPPSHFVDFFHRDNGECSHPTHCPVCLGMLTMEQVRGPEGMRLLAEARMKLGPLPPDKPLNQSPSAPTKVVAQEEPQKMWFGDALDALTGGAKFIRRLSWPEGEYVFFGTSFTLTEDGKENPFECLLHRKSGCFPRPWAMGRLDLENANDWVVISENLSADQ